MPKSTAETYSTRQAAAETTRDFHHKLWSRFGNFRLVAAIIAIVGLWQQWQEPGGIWQVMIVVGVTAFLGIGFEQRKFRMKRDLFASMVEVNRRGLARHEHQWDEIPLPPDAQVPMEHPYARDLNIIGRASIAQRIGTPATRHGWDALYDALLTDRDLADLESRQLAVMELAEEIDLRQNVEAVALAADDIPDSEPLTEWIAANDWLTDRQWMRWLAIIGPVLVIAAVVLVVFRFLPWAVILLPMALNMVVFAVFGRPAAEAVQSAVPMRDAVVSARRIMVLMAKKPAQGKYLRHLDASLDGAAQAMGRLAAIANFAIPPGSMLYFPLQMALMWDVNVLHRLESWRQSHGENVNDWLDAMGEWEALAALSVLTHDNPDWTTPILDSTATVFTSRQLAHPLLHESIAVPNDVHIGPTGSFLFVTGSNMSGKSTLLRAIGANAVLAQAGANVCATNLIMPPLRISSCMRVEDSLAHGVSFFMAELLRLKAVIDRMQQRDDRIGLYLLDEILQGTNTAERQIASRHVLSQLTGLNALGAVSSHDLELIEGTSLEDDAISVHFAEQFTRDGGKPDMTFDYILRPGLATSSNAIRLMEMIGFELPE